MTIQLRATASPSGGNTSSQSITVPVTVQAGDLLLLVWPNAGSDANGDTPPSGWTKLGDTDATNASLMALFLYAKVASGAEAGTTITRTADSIRRHGLALAAYYDDAGATLSVESSVFAASLTIPSQTTVGANCVVVAGAGVRGGGGDRFTPPTGYTERVDTGTDVGSGGKDWTIADKLAPVAAGTSVGGGVFGNADTTLPGAWQVVILPTSSALTGSAALSGTGTLTAGGKPATAGAAALSGTGSLAAGGAPATSGAAALSGTGTLAATGKPQGAGAASLSGSGTLAASGVGVGAGSAALSGTGTLAATGAPTLGTAPALSGVGTLVAAGLPALARAAALSGVGSLAAVGTPSTPELLTDTTLGLHMRVAAYAPNGARQGIIPAPQSLSASLVLNDTGALSLNYPPEGPMGQLLGQPVELVLEVSTDGGQTWGEPENGRFLYLQDGRDPTKDGDPYQISCPGYVRRFAKALVPFTGLNSEGQREFTNALPGAILNPLLAEAQARGALSGMTWDFSAATDSAGVAWPPASAQTIAYAPGTDFLMILQGLADAGLVDYRMQGRTLQVYAAETVMADDHTDDTNRVSLRWGRDLTEAPFRRTWEGLADTAYVQGDNLVSLVRTNGGALTPWGRQETFVQAGGVTDSGTLTVVADGSLAATEDVRVERTYGLDFTEAPYVPFRDYLVGSWVYGATDGNAPERMRVRQITLTRSEQGVSGGNVVLNDRFLESDILQARKLAKVLSGGTLAGTGTPTSTPVGNDILAPAQVTGLGATSSAFPGTDGYPRAQITLDWADVTTNADGTATGDVDHYEVHRRRTGDTTWQLYREVNASLMTDSPYAINEGWEFKVRAVDSVYNRGAFSSVVAITTASDSTPPHQPSQPGASSNLKGAVTITWDGLSSTGGAMDDDLAYVEVHRKNVTGFTPTPGDLATMVYRFRPGGGSFTLTNEPATQVDYIRLVAVDTSFNPSTPSVQRNVTVSKGTDGAVPVVPGGWAPTLKQLGVGALQAQWPLIANTDTVTYDVYVADAAAVAVFDATTLVGSTTGGSLPITALPGGPLLANTDYYLAVRVRDDDGPAAGAGAHGTAGPTKYRQADVGTIAASYVYAGDVEATQVKSGSLLADLAVFGSLALGDAFLMDPFLGLQITMQDGSTTYMRADGSGNRFSGAATLDEALFQGNVTIQGSTNVLSGTMRMGNGITDPTATPTVAQDVPNLSVGGGGRGYNRLGLFATATSYVTTDHLFSGGIQSWAKDGSGESFEVTIDTGSMLGEGGVVQLGTNWYVLGRDVNDSHLWRMRKYTDNTGAAGTSFNVRVDTPATDQRMAIGTDGTDIYVVRVSTTNAFAVEKYNSTTGAFVSQVTMTGTWDAEPVGLYIGNAGGLFAATRYVIATLNGGTRVYSTAGARQTAEEWPDATSLANQGMAFDGGTFRRWDGDTVWAFTDEPGGSREFGVAWYKLDTAPTPDVEYETRVGVTITRTLKRFWRTTITAPRAPSDPNVATSPDTTRVYAGPVGGTLYMQASLPNTGTDTVRVNKLLTAVPEQPSSDYDAVPDAVGKLYSTGLNGAAVATIELNGDGSGRAGPTAWTAAGADATPNAVWTDATLAAGHTTPAGVQQVQATACAGGVIAVRGFVQKTGGFSATTVHTAVATLPVGMRPTVRQDYEMAGNTAASAVKIVVNTDGTIDVVTGATVPSYVAMSFMFRK